MNYRHAFHAGNFADIHKHCLLIALVTYLKQKDKPFWVLDTHAGLGRYDLGGDEAARTGEYHAGIARLIDAPDLPPEAAELCRIVRQVNDGAADTLRFYPGSPLIMRSLLRRKDRLVACELHPQDAAVLKEIFAGDYQVKIHHLDGYLAAKAFLPPKLRRGLVLIDPPFEATDEFDRLAGALADAHKRWPGGIYAAWYPLKDQRRVDRFHKMLQATGIPGLLSCELTVGKMQADTFSGSGLIVANPPWTFPQTAEILSSRLTTILQQWSGPAWRVDWLSPPL